MYTYIHLHVNLPATTSAISYAPTNLIDFSAL